MRLLWLVGNKNKSTGDANITATVVSCPVPCVAKSQRVDDQPTAGHNVPRVIRAILSHGEP